jgi:hypothetical protein
VWHLAAELLAGFPEVVVTAMNTDGYPVSMRERSSRYDAKSGEMPVAIPESVAAVPGPANVLAHYHDEDLSNLQMMQIKRRLEKHRDAWVFVSTAFRPPPRGKFKPRWQMARAMRHSSHRYLATRGLDVPRVNWVALRSLQRQAQLDRRRDL